MSKKLAPGPTTGLGDVRIEVPRDTRRHTHGSLLVIEKGIAPKVSSMSSDFVYVNSAYAGSLNSVNDRTVQVPPTSVIREQYWACSKWPFGQRVLAIAVGILLGAVVGLAITMALSRKDDGIGGVFRTHAAPD